MYKRDEMNNQKKRAPVKISKRFLNEQSERKNFIGLIEKYDLIISIMEHLTLSRKKSSSTFLEKASQIMSNEELNNFALKTYNILESAVVMWDMMGKGRRTNNVRMGEMRSMLLTARMLRIVRLMVYMIPGPRYIRTFETSSEIRFIKSPVLFRLKKL